MIRKNSSLLILFLTLSILACADEPKLNSATTENKASSAACRETLETHLDAVSKRDIRTLRETLSPDGDMEFMMGGLERMIGATDFAEFQASWFQDSSWTFETDILHLEVGETLASATVEAMYREADRDGQPYFNRLHISYVLRKHGDEWYIIKDHASSAEKSTD